MEWNAGRCVKRFRGGLVFLAHRLLYHATLGSRVINKQQKKMEWCTARGPPPAPLAPVSPKGKGQGKGQVKGKGKGKGKRQG